MKIIFQSFFLFLSFSLLSSAHAEYYIYPCDADYYFQTAFIPSSFSRHSKYYRYYLQNENPDLSTGDDHPGIYPDLDIDR